jgi:hypothetical protein
VDVWVVKSTKLLEDIARAMEKIEQNAKVI